MEVRPIDLFGMTEKTDTYNPNEDRCRFDHPPVNQNVSSANRFAALQLPDNTTSRNSNSFQGGGKHGP
jgi:hypothetical protein